MVKMDSSSLHSCIDLVPDWMTRLLEDYKNEVEGADDWAIKLLEKEARKAVWNMCSLMGVNTHGVPALTCRLLERYLSTHMREYVNFAADQEEWKDFKLALVARIPLLIASCAQLAAKMSCAGLQVNPNTARTCLLCTGVVYTVTDIISSEFQVFSTLGYRVPLWTSLDVAQLLAVRLGMRASIMEALAVVVDLAEYHRDRLDDRVRDIANILPPPSTSFNKATLRTLHLAAGAVAATARYFHYKGRDPIPRLAKYTRAPSCYIKCVCNVILDDVLIDDD